MLKEKLEQIKKTGYPLSASETLRRAYTIIFKKILLQSALFFIGYFILLLFAQYISYKLSGFDLGEYIREYKKIASSGNIEQLSEFLRTNTPYSGSASIFYYGMLILINPLLVGFVEMVKNADLGKKYSLIDVFIPYASLKIFGIMMITFIIMLLSNIGMSFYIIPGIYIAALLSLSPMIYWFNKDASFGESLSASITVVNRNFWSILRTLILLAFIAVLGIFAFFIGIIFTLPIFYAGCYFMYKAIFMQHTEMEDMG